MRTTLTALSCVVAAVALALACSAPAPREREVEAQPAVKGTVWEYKTAPIIPGGQGVNVPAEVEAVLNRFAADGWEYIGTDRAACFVFRRPKR